MTYIIRRTLPLVFAFLIIPTENFAQITNYQFEDLEKLQQAEKRPVLVFIHTDWCKYCLTMDNTTFKNREIIELINNHFYFVKFNAEERRSIKFKKSVFKFKPSGVNTGVHELAEQLGTVDRKISYPTLCFLNYNDEVIFQYPQYINPKELKNTLNLLM